MKTRLGAMLRHLPSVFRLPQDADLLRAELAAFTKQVPLMYVIVMVNMTALAATHYSTAPAILTLYIPAMLDVLCCIRIAVWFTIKSDTWTVEQAIKRLRGTVITAGFLTACFTAWSLSLFPYGDAYAKSHVAFFMAVTVIGCAFCLTHLRPAMLLVMTLVVVPLTVYFCSTGNSTLIMIALNFVIVAVAVIFMLLTHYDGFETLVTFQKVLLQNQRDLRALNEQNFAFSNTDLLTSLPNRRRFFAIIEEQILRCRTNGSGFAVGIINLDNFKAVNDAHGYLVGDQLLVLASQRLTAHLKTDAFLARLGGDEFVVIRDNLNAANVVEFGERIRDLFIVPFEVNQISVRLGITVGFASFTHPASSAQELFEQANYALHFAKDREKGSVTVYSVDHEANVRRAGAVANALANADLENELWVAYQPIVDATNGKTIAFEALARWKSPLLGNVSPSVFIPSAERAGLINLLTPMLLRKALNEASRWPAHIRLSFNLSAIDINSPTAMLTIIKILAEAPIPPSRVDFEITETAVLLNVKRAAEALIALKRAGVRIALDDFGTGFSSLSCIRELPLDEIKIDRSFVEPLDFDYSSRVLMKSMINLCGNLGLKCVVEGVETAQQLAILKDTGATFLQGYLFGKPMPGELVLEYLSSSNPTLLQQVAQNGR